MPSKMKFLLGLVTFSVTLRLLPYLLTAYSVKVDPSVVYYPWNFMPMMAVCLYSGAYVTDRRWSFGLPLVAVFVSDLLIWAVTGQFAWGFQSDRWSAYLCYASTVLMGTGLNTRRWPVRGVDAFARGMLAEVVFFLGTNFAYFCIQTDYPHSFAGLLTCYVAAIPFAGRSFLSTAFYSVLLFSPLAVRAAEPQTATETGLQTAVSR